MSGVSRNWCFTWNNYTLQDLEDISKWEVKFIKYGIEVGALGTPHLQGYVVLDKTVRLSGVKKMGPKCHWEIMKGSIEQNDTYCEKDGEFFSRGIKPMSQKRKGEVESERWDLALRAAKEGRFEDIPSEIALKYCRNIDYIRNKELMKRPVCLDGELTNQWVWGAAGAGKSRSAYEENPGAFLKGANKWWDGYLGQDTVIVDDIDPNHKVLGHHMKLWGQHQPFPAEVKGGTICIRPKKIIITSQYRIDEVFEDEPTREAIHRRFKEVYIPSNKTITDNSYKC